MYCPNCREDAYSFIKMYLWPYGKKECPVCKKKSKVKNMYILSLISLILGALAALPTLISGNPLYLIPMAVIVLSIDVVMDYNCRTMQSIEVKQDKNK
jgi:hypothetical protein